MTKNADDSLLSTLARWLERFDHGFHTLTPLAGDVSPRRYVRVLGGRKDPAIAAYYPPDERETGERFLRTGRLLTRAGVRVPEVLEWDPDAGLMLLEDAGLETVYQAVLRGEDPAPWQAQAVEIGTVIAQLPHAEVEALNRPLDGPILRRELQQSWDLVLEPQGLVGDGNWAQEFRLSLFALCDHLHAAPRSPCHRDFMLRNLLLGPRRELVLIDHQDLRMGPRCYDLASLLNDTLYATPREQREALDRARIARPAREGYHRAAAQRALKIVGTFAAFAKRGVDRYEPLIPASLTAARYHLARLPETSALMVEAPPTWEIAAAQATRRPC